MNNTVSGKTMENVRNHRNTKIVSTINKEINLLQSQITIQPNTCQKIY